MLVSYSVVPPRLAGITGKRGDERDLLEVATPKVAPKAARSHIISSIVLLTVLFG